MLRYKFSRLTNEMKLNKKTTAKKKNASRSKSNNEHIDESALYMYLITGEYRVACLLFDRQRFCYTHCSRSFSRSLCVCVRHKEGKRQTTNNQFPTKFKMKQRTIQQWSIFTIWLAYLFIFILFFPNSFLLQEGKHFLWKNLQQNCKAANNMK